MIIILRIIFCPMSLWPWWLQYLSVEETRSVASFGHCRSGWNKEVISYMYAYIIIVTVKQIWGASIKKTEYRETMRYDTAAFYIIGLYWEKLVQNSCNYLSRHDYYLVRSQGKITSPLFNCKFHGFSLFSGVLHTYIHIQEHT